MDAGVEGMMLSPGYSYDKAPDQQHFTGRESNQSMFRKILSNRDPRWQLQHVAAVPGIPDGQAQPGVHALGNARRTAFSAGRSPATCCRTAMPILIRNCSTPPNGRKYGYESGNPKCANCMLHSGYEASAVDYTFSFKGIFATMRAMLFSRYRDQEAARQVAAEKPKPTLVQIDAIAPRPTLTGIEGGGPARLTDGIEQAFDYRGDVTMTLGQRREASKATSSIASRRPIWRLHACVS